MSDTDFKGQEVFAAQTSAQNNGYDSNMIFQAGGNNMLKNCNLGVQVGLENYHQGSKGIVQLGYRNQSGMFDSTGFLQIGAINEADQTCKGYLQLGGKTELDIFGKRIPFVGIGGDVYGLVGGGAIAAGADQLLNNGQGLEWVLSNLPF